MTAVDVSVLKLSLHDTTVGYLVGFQDGRNVLHFAPEFKVDPSRPTFSLITHPAFPNVDNVLSKPWTRRQRLQSKLSGRILICWRSRPNRMTSLDFWS